VLRFLGMWISAGAGDGLLLPRSLFVLCMSTPVDTAPVSQGQYSIVGVNSRMRGP
jgi:hypothetical protein